MQCCSDPRIYNPSHYCTKNVTKYVTETVYKYDTCELAKNLVDPETYDKVEQIFTFRLESYSLPLNIRFLLCLVRKLDGVA